MNIYTFKKFLEANIDLPELRDPKRGMPPRGNILVKKLKDGEELQVGTKKVVVDKMAQFIDTPTGVSASWVEPEEGVSQIIQPSGAYDPNKADKYFKYKNKYRPVFKDKDDFEFKLDQIFKSKDFGSRGPGGDTINFESVQAIFIGIKVDDPLTVLKPSDGNKIYDPSDFLKKSDGNIKHSYKKFIDDGGLEDVKLSPNIQIDYNTLEKYLSDKHWVSTFCEIPNRLWIEGENIKKYIEPGVKYITYHTGYKGSDSPYVNLLKKYKELSKSGNGGIKKGIFTNIDYSKWCPADIYLVDKKLITSSGQKEDEPNINIEISKVTNIYDLVNVVERFFIPKQFIPISLKKVKQGGEFSIITNGGRGANLPEFEIVKFRINADSMGIGSKIYTQSEWKYMGKKFTEKDRVINFDSSDTSKPVNIDGEVEGSSSKHGKISLNYIVRSISSVLKGKIRTMGGINIKTHAEIKSNLSKQRDPNQALQDKIRDISDDIIKLSNSNPTLNGLLSIVKVSKNGTDTNGDINAGISRYQSLQVIYSIMKAYSIDVKTGNKIMTKIMRYALSIETEYFNTPMYLRVI
jgi:hypothetical protein